MGITAILMGCQQSYDFSMFKIHTSQVYITPPSPTDSHTDDVVTIRFECKQANGDRDTCFYVCDEGGGLAPNGKVGCYYPPAADGVSSRGRLYSLETPDHQSFNKLQKVTAGDGADQKNYWVFTYKTNVRFGSPIPGDLGMMWTANSVKIAPYDPNNIPGDPVTVVGRAAEGGQPIDWRRAPGEMRLRILYLPYAIPVSCHVESGKTYFVQLIRDRYKYFVTVSEIGPIGAEELFHFQQVWQE